MFSPLILKCCRKESKKCFYNKKSKKKKQNKFSFYKMSMKNYNNLGLYSVIVYFTVGLMGKKK